MYKRNFFPRSMQIPLVLKEGIKSNNNCICFKFFNSEKTNNV